MPGAGVDGIIEVSDDDLREALGEVAAQRAAAEALATKARDGMARCSDSGIVSLSGSFHDNTTPDPDSTTDKPDGRPGGTARITNWHQARVSKSPAEAVIIWSVSNAPPSGSDDSPTTGSGAALRRQTHACQD